MGEHTYGGAHATPRAATTRAPDHRAPTPGPRSVEELAKALHTNPEHIRGLIESLDRKVGIVPLYRFATCRYGLAE
jgi:hypothetical protein